MCFRKHLAIYFETSCEYSVHFFSYTLRYCKWPVSCKYRQSCKLEYFASAKFCEADVIHCFVQYLAKIFAALILHKVYAINEKHENEVICSAAHPPTSLLLLEKEPTSFDGTTSVERKEALSSLNTKRLLCAVFID